MGKSCFVAGAIIALVVLGCGSDNPSGPSQSKIENRLGSEYYGLYEVTNEIGNCNFRCNWERGGRVDTIQFCSAETELVLLASNGPEAIFKVEEKSGIISEDSISFVYRGKIAVTIDGDTCTANFELIGMSRYLGETLDITPGYFRFFIVVKIKGCAEITSLPIRYTFRRIGEC